MLGVSTPDLYRLPVFPSLVHGLEGAARENGLNLVLASLQPDDVLPAALSGGQVDGVLLLGKPEMLSAAARERLQTIASVGLMRGFAELGTTLDRVLYDNAAVGPMAADYLLSRGHSRIAFFNVFPDHDAFDMRRRDFAAVIAGAGRSPVLELVAEQRPQDLRAEVATYDSLVAQLLEAPQRPTGLFVPSDAQLPALYQSLELRGINPARDIDVVSCDHEEQFLARLSSLPATVDINLQLVGRRGVQQLLWRLSNLNEKSRITILVEPVLIAGSDALR